ncbi:MAG: ABC transporter ATP-binding protein [Thermoanaerobaculia bacterium]
MDAITTRALTKVFGATRAVDGLNLTVPQGEIFGIVGPDGAGKTTTLRLLASIMDPTEGDAFIFGKHTVRDADAVKDDIAYMSQRFGLYPDLTVMENLLFYADLYGVTRAERPQRIERLLAFSNMTPFKQRRAGNLSGGMKQKLGLACALVHAPKVLLLDEPTNGVDPVSRRDFWKILADLRADGVTIVVSTAYLDEAERCDRVGLLHDGKLMAVDTPAGIRRLLPGATLEIRADATRRAAALLREHVRSESIVLFGDRINLTTRTPETTEAEVRELLARNGIAVESLIAVEPSLENVFVSLLSGGAS